MNNNLKNKKIQNAADTSILLTLTNTLTTGLSILLAAIGVRYLPKESYGIYLQVMFLLNTTLMILEFGMPKSVYYFMPRVKNKRKFVFHTFSILNILGIFALGIFIVGKHKIGVILNSNEIVYALSFLAFYIFLSTNRIIFPSVLLSTGNGKVLIITRAIMSVLSFCAVVIPMVLSMGLEGVLWGLLIFHIIQYGVIGVVSLRTTEGQLSQIKKSECLVEQFKFLVPLGLISLISIFSTSIDRFIISFFMGIENFAIYDRGAIRIPLIGTLSITVGAVILPKIVEYFKSGEIDRLLSIWHASIEKVALIIFPCFFFLIIFAREIITLLYTDRFGESVTIFRLYVFSLLPNITIYGNIFNAANKNKIFLIITIIAASIQAPLCVLLVKIYGNIGPAIAIVVVYILIFVVTIPIIKIILNTTIAAVFPWRFLAKLFCCAGLSGSLIWVFGSTFHQNDLIKVFMCLPLYFIVYYIIANWMRLIKIQDKEILKKWLGVNWFKKRWVKIVNGAKA